MTTIDVMWRISSADGARYVQAPGAGGALWEADPETAETIDRHAGEPVDTAPMAGVYDPPSTEDPVGLFLLARTAVPRPHTVTGTPPQVPPPPPVPAGAVC